jgi:hypothetical protein
MVNLELLKKGDLRYISSVIFEITKNDVANQKIEITRHQIFAHLDPPEIKHDKPTLVSYTYLKNHRPFQNTAALDADGMQGYIIGIFERD